MVRMIVALRSIFVTPLANTLVFILMAIVMLVRTAGLFGSVEAT